MTRALRKKESMTSREEEMLNRFLKTEKPSREQEKEVKELLERLKSELNEEESNYERELALMEKKEEELAIEKKNFQLLVAHCEELEEEKNKSLNQLQPGQLPLTQEEFRILLSVLPPERLVSFGASIDTKLQTFGYKTSEYYYIRATNPLTKEIIMEQSIPLELIAKS